MIPGAEAGPARGVGRGGEDGHVHAELGDEDFSGPPADPRDGVQAGEGLRERGQEFLQAIAERGDRLVEVVEVGQRDPADPTRRTEPGQSRKVRSVRSISACVRSGARRSTGIVAPAVYQAASRARAVSACPKIVRSSRSLSAPRGTSGVVRGGLKRSPPGGGVHRRRAGSAERGTAATRRRARP